MVSGQWSVVSGQWLASGGVTRFTKTGTPQAFNIELRCGFLTRLLDGLNRYEWLRILIILLDLWINKVHKRFVIGNDSGSSSTIMAT